MSPSSQRVWIEIATMIYCIPYLRRSPSSQRVWIEIEAEAETLKSKLSPSSQRVWIEITWNFFYLSLDGSPSSQRVWIEISDIKKKYKKVNRRPLHRGCGLKSNGLIVILLTSRRPLHRGCGLKWGIWCTRF